MPHPWALVDSSFPTFTGEESSREQVQQIVESVGDAAAEQKDTDTAKQVAAVVNEILSRGEK